MRRTGGQVGLGTERVYSPGKLHQPHPMLAMLTVNSNYVEVVR